MKFKIYIAFPTLLFIIEILRDITCVLCAIPPFMKTSYYPKSAYGPYCLLNPI